MQHHAESKTCPVAIKMAAEGSKGRITLGFVGLREGGRPEGCQCTGRGEFLLVTASSFLRASLSLFIVLVVRGCAGGIELLLI